MSVQFLWHWSGIVQVLHQTLKLCQHFWLQNLSFFTGRKCFVLFSIDPICHIYILSRIQYRSLKWRIPIYRCISAWGRAVFIVFIAYHCHQSTREWFQAIFAGVSFLQSSHCRALFWGGLTSGTTSKRSRSWACLCRISILKDWVRTDAFVARLRSTCRFEGPLYLWVLVPPFCLHIWILNHLKVNG